MVRICSVIFVSLALSASGLSQAKRVIVQPRDTGAALVNPNMGWVFHHYDNNITRYGLELEASDIVDEFPGASAVYLRLAWSYIEPEEGKFNWSIVDTPAQRWIAKGKQVAFRFSCAESAKDQPYATPEWVLKAGAKGYHFVPRHAKYFKKTLIAANDDLVLHGRGLEVLHYARRHGMTLRDDSILVQPGDKAYHSAYMAPMFWPELPVVLESEHFGPSRDKGYWQDGSRYLDAVEDYHASWATVHWYPREFLKEARPLIDKINLRLGYRLQLLEASWPETVDAGGVMAVGYRWRNAGVAPCYPGGHPAITLKDAKGGIAGVFVDEEFDMRSLPAGAPGQAHPVGREIKSISQASRPLMQFRLPPPNILKPGTYDLLVSVGSRTGTPKIALPLAAEDGQRRYLLGRITVK